MLIEDLKKRWKNLRSIMEEQKISAILITDKRNVFYLTGKSFGSLLITKNLEMLFLDDLHGKIYEEFYKHEQHIFETYQIESEEEFFIKLSEILKKLKIEKLLVDSKNFEILENMKKKLKVNLKYTNILRELRAIKSEYEILSLKESANIAKKVMKKAYEVIEEGVKEKEAIAEIEAMIRKLGSEEPPFGSGVLLSSGKDSAEIHPVVKKDKRIKANIVVLDLGAKVNGYYSDMTRTIKIATLNNKDEKIFKFVRDLEMEVIDKVKEGAKANELYKFAENEIKKLGYKFYHSLGHGIGLEVHELPNLSPNSKDVLNKGMVFTIEPGIYIPKKFGVRFEDMLLLNKKGEVEILTKI